MPNIGPNEELPFLDDYYLLADLGYRSAYPIMTPYSQADIRAGGHPCQQGPQKTPHNCRTPYQTPEDVLSYRKSLQASKMEDDQDCGVGCWTRRTKAALVLNSARGLQAKSI